MMNAREWIIYRTEQLLLPDTDRDCLVCKGQGRTDPIRIPNRAGMLTKPCFLCGGDGKLESAVNRSLMGQLLDINGVSTTKRALKLGYYIANAERHGWWWSVCEKSALVCQPPAYRYIYLCSNTHTAYLDLSAGSEVMQEEGCTKMMKLAKRLGETLHRSANRPRRFYLKVENSSMNDLVCEELRIIAEEHAKRANW